MKSKKRLKIIVIILSLSLVISSILVYNIVNILKYRTGRPEQIIYKSSAHSDILYNIYLKPNDFFDEPYLGENFSYITTLIEYIKTTFKYHFQGDENISVDYDYYIKGEMVTNFMSDGGNGPIKPLWIKDFILLKHHNGHSNNSKINIDETLNIGLDFYNSLLNDFRDNTDLILDSRLDVSLIVNINGKLPNDKSLSTTHSLTMSVPLGVRAFDLTESKNFPEHGIVYSKKQPKVETAYMISIIYIVLLIIVLWVTTILIRLVLNKDINKHEALVNKILKNYDDRIVTVTNFIRYKGMEVINVSSFEELLTLSEETLEPIIHWEKKGPNSIETWFSVIKNRVLYCYIISCKK